jgi:hypothetical protein
MSPNRTGERVTRTMTKVSSLSRCSIRECGSFENRNQRVHKHYLHSKRDNTSRGPHDEGANARHGPHVHVFAVDLLQHVASANQIRSSSGAAFSHTADNKSSHPIRDKNKTDAANSAIAGARWWGGCGGGGRRGILRLLPRGVPDSRGNNFRSCSCRLSGGSFRRRSFGRSCLRVERRRIRGFLRGRNGSGAGDTVSI